ncbi:Transcription elongation factor GreA [subsurface metagenome]
MTDVSQGPSLNEAASRFLASLPVEERGANQPVIFRFVLWYGRERPLASLTAPEIAHYAERLPASDTDHKKRLALIRAFLGYARKVGWIRSSLSSHLKARKPPKSRLSSRQGVPKSLRVTRQGYDEMERELSSLKGKRLRAIEEIRRAAADKDFRENAPLDAAREGRIKELEAALKSAVVLDENQEVTARVGLGDSIVLHDLTSGQEMYYTIVSPREVDPARGKISSVSPIGRAVTNHASGEIIEITVPAGKIRYQIERIER